MKRKYLELMKVKPVKFDTTGAKYSIARYTASEMKPKTNVMNPTKIRK